jgi:hypothetical protein
MKLHLGVIDFPYTYGDKAMTTGDVAVILEDKYEIMGTYWEKHGQEGADALAEGMAGTLESLLMGAPPTQDPFGTGTSKIEDGFRKFLDAREMDGIEGIPTQASLDGVNSRLKKQSGDQRPSFIDGGLYQSSFKAWVK